MKQVALPLWATPRALPETRAECPETRPCPYVSCRHHMLIESVRRPGRVEIIELSRIAVAIAGKIPERWSDEQIAEILEALPYSCVLDAAAKEGLSQYEIAEALRVNRTRIEAIEAEASQKIKEAISD